jgi:hypothetical protein
MSDESISPKRYAVLPSALKAMVEGRAQPDMQPVSTIRACNPFTSSAVSRSAAKPVCPARQPVHIEIVIDISLLPPVRARSASLGQWPVENDCGRRHGLACELIGQPRDRGADQPLIGVSD